MAELSPMMQQYFKIKEENKDSILFFRLGDFYEMFYDTSLVSGLIIQEEARFVYWQTAQRINFVFVQC